MARIETSIQIDRSLGDVYAYATNVDNLTQWLTAVVEAEQLTDGRWGWAPGSEPSARCSGDAWTRWLR